VSYTAQFQQYANRTDWNDEALKNQYYRGLKDFIKDEMARSDRPDDLKDMIELSQKIDNRHYERKLEKGGHQPTWTSRKLKQKSHWPQPMELDATFKPSGRPRNPNKERQLKERLCFNCNKPGHMARDCKQPRKGNGGRRTGRQLNATWQGQAGCNPRGGQLNATYSNQPDWDLDTDDLAESESSGEESLTISEQEVADSMIYSGPDREEWTAQQARGHCANMRDIQRQFGASKKELDKHHQGRMDALNQFERRWLEQADTLAVAPSPPPTEVQHPEEWELRAD